MAVAMQAATGSPGPYTQNGATILLADGQVALSERSYPEHAESNEILSAARQGIATEGATLVTPWAPCVSCARAIVESGFATLVRFGDSETHKDEERSIADVILQEGGVEVIEIDPTTLEIPAIRRDGEIWRPLSRRIMWHVALPTGRASIAAHGLDKVFAQDEHRVWDYTRGRDEGVYLWDEYGEAIAYAWNLVDMGHDPDVYRVDATDLEVLPERIGGTRVIGSWTTNRVTPERLQLREFRVRK
jgi:dCMP deaminase